MKITDFVIGLGFDTSDFDHGMKTATQQIGNFKSTVLQAGAALGMAFSFKGLTFDFAKQVNQARQLGITSEFPPQNCRPCRPWRSTSGRILVS